MSNSPTLEILCDASPFLFFEKILYGVLKVSDRFVSLSNLSFELIRLEMDDSAAGAGKLTVRIYPSDAFLRFGAAMFAGNVDFGLVEKSVHGVLLKPALTVR